MPVNLTIFIPVYERTEYFETAVESVQRQTREVDLVVVDNASTHPFFSNYCRKNGIPYHRNERNLGVFGNWNRCVSLCNSDYIFILGDDDFLEPDYVEVFEERLNETEGPLDFYYCDVNLRFEENGTLKEGWWIPPKTGLFSGPDLVHFFGQRGVSVPSISGIIRTRLLRENPYMDKTHGSNDWLWICRNCHAWQRIYGESSRLLTYRKHASSDSLNNRFEIVEVCHPVFLLELEEVAERHLKLPKLASRFGRMAVTNSLELKAKRGADYARFVSLHDNFYARRTSGDWRLRLIAVAVPGWAARLLLRFWKQVFRPNRKP